MRAGWEMSKVKSPIMNPQGRRKDPARFGVSSCLFHAKKTPGARGGSLNKQKNVFFREMMIFDLKIKYSYSPGEMAKVKLK